MPRNKRRQRRKSRRRRGRKRNQTRRRRRKRGGIPLNKPPPPPSQGSVPEHHSVTDTKPTVNKFGYVGGRRTKRRTRKRGGRRRYIQRGGVSMSDIARDLNLSMGLARTLFKRF